MTLQPVRQQYIYMYKIWGFYGGDWRMLSSGI
jgi:hypothetical protein